MGRQREKKRERQDDVDDKHEDGKKRLISLDRYALNFSRYTLYVRVRALLRGIRETNRSCYWANSRARHALLTNAVIKFVFRYRRRFFTLRFCLRLSPGVPLILLSSCFLFLPRCPPVSFSRVRAVPERASLASCLRRV